MIETVSQDAYSSENTVEDMEMEISAGSGAGSGFGWEVVGASSLRQDAASSGNRRISAVNFFMVS